MRLRSGSKRLETKHEIIEVGVPTRNMLLSYILGYIAFHLKLASLVKSNRYDCMILSNIFSPLIPVIARGRPIVFDYKDVYSLSASVPFKTPVRQFLYWVTRVFEQILFCFKMTVVVPSPSMQRVVRDRFNVDSVLISNGVNTELFHPISESTRAKVRAELGILRGEFCLCYLGSIENWVDLEGVVQALLHLKSLRLIMIGGPPRSGEYMRHIMALCDKGGVSDRVIWTGFKKQAEAARILSACDAAIVPFPLDRELSAVALPDKVFEYLASGVPVISTRLPDVEKLFRDYVYFYDTHEELFRILSDLQAHMKRKCSASDQLTQAEKYDWRRIAASYCALIVSLLTHGVN